jgi:hypothetical protein
VAGIVLFGESIRVQVEFARLWSGPAFHAEHEFDAAAKSLRQIDVRLTRLNAPASGLLVGNDA